MLGSALQIVLPDENGNFPCESGYDWEPIPLLPFTKNEGP